MGQSIRYEAFDKRLAGHGANINSQFGEDGLIKRVFEIMPPVNRWCLEVGAADGEFYSNTLSLRREDWRAILIEKGKEAFDRLNAKYGRESHCFNAPVTSLDPFLTKVAAPANIDFVSIDIDGHDYWVWVRTSECRPRVVLIEYCYWRGDEYYLPPEQSAESPENQASEHPILELAKDRGYTLVARTYCNLLFVDSNEWEKDL